MRTYPIKRTGAAIALALFCCSTRGAETGGTCRLSVGGKQVTAGTHAIAIRAKPTPQETHAAKEFAEELRLLTGEKLPVVPEGEVGKRTPIVVGRCEGLLGKLGVNVDFDALGVEGIVLRTKGPALILAGNRRGVLYAAFTFMEDHCGVQWLTPDCTVRPTGGDIRVGKLDRRYLPPLEYRSTDYPCSRPGDWAVRNKVNGTQTRLTEAQGGKIAYSHFVHTFNAILNPAEHFDEHPEWFSMIDGKRRDGRTQLCLTNPQVLAKAKEAVRRWIAESPGATIFSVSQNDWHNYCRCPKCSALAEKEGSQAGPIIHFVNALAKDIAQDHPDKLISTLAYQYSRKPPKHVRPRPNVCVRLCSIECCFSHALQSCPKNASFVQDIRDWNKICDRLYIWDYVINYHHSVMPHPNFHVLKPNIRFFIDHGVKGIYEEACYFTESSELAELRTWVMAKTLWDPSYDTQKAIDEFCTGYYGPAGEAIREYVALITDQVKGHPKRHMHIWSKPTEPYLNDAMIAEAVTLFDRAERAVRDNPALLHRVRVARMPVQYTRIAKADGDVGGLIDAFEATARKANLQLVREHRKYGDLEKWLERMRAANAKRVKAAKRE